MNNRVVVTGLGVCAPNGVGLDTFFQALRDGQSGIRFVPELERLNFGCQIAAQPDLSAVDLSRYFTSLQLQTFSATGLIYGVVAGKDAWDDAGLLPADKKEPDWKSGIIFGTGLLGVDPFREAIHKVDAGQVRRLGSSAVVQTMASGISAFLAGLLGCGNQVTTNSSACTTGTESIWLAWERIRLGHAERILAGSCSDSGPYIWGGFDAMRVLPRNYNDSPGQASRPMSATARGFVPGSGAGALVLESLPSARRRGARIYAEVLGGAVNSGGQRNGGSMTAPNPEGIRRCIRQSLINCGITAADIDSVNGHLTATAHDPDEISGWCDALGRTGTDFPLINSFKGVIGHCLAASGSLECVGSVLQIWKSIVFGNRNCEDLHPAISDRIARDRVPIQPFNTPIRHLIKASFGFGDVNACIIFKQYAQQDL